MNIYEQYAFTKSYHSYGLKVLRIQPKFVAYNVSINKNFCIRSFLVLSATIELEFLKLFKGNYSKSAFNLPRHSCFNEIQISLLQFAKT